MPDWSPRELRINGDNSVSIPLMAFWGQPFDQFRSAIAMVYRNGLPDADLAADIARKFWCHVLICGDEDTSLWLLEQSNVRQLVQRVPIDQISSMLMQQSSSLDRLTVARQKLRLRQYALYESDPDAQAFAEWAIKPSADQVSTALTEVIRATLATTSKNTDAEARSLDVSEPSRWAFRLLALRIAKDRGWPIAEGLEREDVKSFWERAIEYPTYWKPELATSRPTQLGDLTEAVLASLLFWDFSTIDPALVVRALGSPVLKIVKSALDLFPTPKTIAWDMVSALPMSLDHSVCDPTSGTGTFLVAAGHAIWESEGPDSSIRQLLLRQVVGGDQSALAADLTRISLDLAFGWDPDGWDVRTSSAEETIAALDTTRTWALVSNLPWSGRGRGQNEAARLLREYLKFSASQDAGWIATITPKSIWTKRDENGRRLRTAVSRDFEFEHVWELGWDAVKGGRSQSVATIMRRRSVALTMPERVVVWKRAGQDGTLRTIGYRRPWSQDEQTPQFLGPDASYFSELLAGDTTIETFCNVHVGLQPKSKAALAALSDKTTEAVPFFLSPTALTDRTESDIQAQYWVPQSLVDDDEYIERVFAWPARSYRLGYRRPSQFVIPQELYEGVHRLRVGLVGADALFSNRFLICVPKNGSSREVILGIAVSLNSVLGRIWLHQFALAGRHLAKRDIERFPLPPEDQLAEIGRKAPPLRGAVSALPFSFGRDLEAQVDVCHAYGFHANQVAATLGIGHILGLGPRIPRELVRQSEVDRRFFAGVQAELGKIVEKPTTDLSEEERNRAMELWSQGLNSVNREHFLILSTDDVEISLELSTIAEG